VGENRSNKLEIKIAENLPEWESSFRLLYNEYFEAGYVTETISSQMLFGIHHFLSKTVVFIAKISDVVVSTLTQFFDDRIFGLPMDMIYKKELDQLRHDGRVVSEIGCLATSSDYRMQHQFMDMCQAMYWYARFKKVDDICIAVNPKHVQFYKTVFLFEEFGPVRFYPKVHAPAALMRLDTAKHEQKMEAAYQTMEDSYNLHHQWYKFKGRKIEDYSIPLRREKIINGKDITRMNSSVVNHFLSCNKGLMRSLSPKYITYLKAIYPNIRLLFPIHTHG